jgi:hypothetical protein
MNRRREIAFIPPQLSIMSAFLSSWPGRSTDRVCDSFRAALLSVRITPNGHSIDLPRNRGRMTVADVLAVSEGR